MFYVIVLKVQNFTKTFSEVKFSSIVVAFPPRLDISVRIRETYLQPVKLIY